MPSITVDRIGRRSASGWYRDDRHPRSRPSAPRRQETRPAQAAASAQSPARGQADGADTARAAARLTAQRLVDSPAAATTTCGESIRSRLEGQRASLLLDKHHIHDPVRDFRQRIAASLAA